MLACAMRSTISNVSRGEKNRFFMMPMHDPNRDYTSVLDEDREAILLAEKLGFSEAWVGEHYSAKTEPIPDPLQFMATLIPQTKSITFATGVINIPQHHPAM